MATVSEEVRVRFAPSPTGYFHVGGARTALYNWLFARQRGGKLILRIEDTDTERSDPAWTEGILKALEWLNISIDEGPYFQSQRKNLYLGAAEKLFLSGHAYACDCTREDIDGRKKEGSKPGYDNYCRERGLVPGVGRALRFRVPDTGVTVVNDIVRGEVEFANVSIEDFVLLKSSGDPLFVLAVVVDDQDMGITHIIRAEEHLPTTPKALLLWQALSDKKLPVFAHLPVLVNEKRQKLSKRRDRVAVEDYRAMGILPEAMFNYLTVLGWAPKDGSEIFKPEKALAEFDLGQVNHSPAFFDEKRLFYFNGHYIRSLTDGDFVERALPHLEKAYPNLDRQDILSKFVPLAAVTKERVTTLEESVGLLAFLFDVPFSPDGDDFQKLIGESDFAESFMRDVLEHFKQAADADGRGSLAETGSGAGSGTGFDAELLKAVLIQCADKAGLKLAKAQAPIRVSVLGKKTGLPLFEALETLGPREVIARLENALARLAAV